MRQRHTFDRGDHLEISLWLVLSRDGSVRCTRASPDLSRDERALSLTLKAPKALWAVPQLRATLTIEAPDPDVPPIDLTAANAALKEALGVDIDLRVNGPE